MLQWLHNSSEYIRTPVEQVLGHMSHFHLGIVNAESRGRCRPQCCWCRCHWQWGSRKFCFINGAACRGSMCLAEQVMSDMVRRGRTHSDTVKHCQTSSGHVSVLVGTTPQCIVMYSADVMWCTVMNVSQALRSFQMFSVIIHIPSRHSFFKGWPRDSASALYTLLPSHVEPLNFRWVSSNLFDSRCVEFAGFGTFGCGICTGTSTEDKHCRRAPCGFCFGFCSGFFWRPESHWRPECQTRVGRSGDPSGDSSGDRRTRMKHTEWRRMTTMIMSWLEVTVCCMKQIRRR